jgi:hypothetical protein
MAEDDRPRLRHLGGQVLEAADALARQLADPASHVRPRRGQGVVLRGGHAHHARRLRGAVVAHERSPQRQRDLAEDLAGRAPADRLLDAVELLRHLDLAGDDGEQRALLALVDHVLAGGEVDVGRPLRQLIQLGGGQGREDRDARQLFDGQHGATRIEGTRVSRPGCPSTN